jgi:hypothetical protein
VSDVDALNRTLAVEHRTIYAYGVVGGHASVRATPLATAGFVAHRARRDQLEALVRGAGGVPVAADPAYAMSTRVTDPLSAASVAAALEDACAVAYEQLVVAAQDPALRTLGATVLVEVATRAARWRLLAGVSATLAFPGRG